MRSTSYLSALLLASACATAPRPNLLSEVDVVRASDSARETRELVPQAEAKAEKLRSDAEAAWPKGHTATAEILAERALVAYADGRELARIVRAQQRLLATKAELHQAEVALQKLDAEQKGAAAEAADLEAQLRVEREAESLAEPKLTTPDREHARLVASKTAVTQARLLCVSAKLVRAGSADANVEGAIAAVDAMEAKLARGKSNQPVPIRDAIAVRSRCQQLLVEARRPNVLANPTSERADQLFVDLAQAGFSPSRDDRGIVVTLGRPFAGDRIGSEAATKLTELGRLAQQNEHTPLLVIAHASKGDPSPSDRRRADDAAAKLKSAGVQQLEVQVAGGRLPVAQSSDLGASRSNERLELIFVTRI